jgi:hypothetical protein
MPGCKASTVMAVTIAATWYGWLAMWAGRGCASRLPAVLLAAQLSYAVALLKVVITHE